MKHKRSERKRSSGKMRNCRGKKKWISSINPTEAFTAQRSDGRIFKCQVASRCLILLVSDSFGQADLSSFLHFIRSHLDRPALPRPARPKLPNKSFPPLEKCVWTARCARYNKIFATSPLVSDFWRLELLSPSLDCLQIREISPVGPPASERPTRPRL